MTASVRHRRVRVDGGGAGRGANNAAYSFSAPAPPLSGEPGERIATCTASQLIKRGNKTQVRLTFLTDEWEEGHYWIELPDRLTSNCKYMNAVAVALGRRAAFGEEITPDIFVTKKFRCEIGWRKSDRVDGKDRLDDSLAKRGPKDARDFLRVHALLGLLDADSCDDRF